MALQLDWEKGAKDRIYTKRNELATRLKTVQNWFDDSSMGLWKDNTDVASAMKSVGRLSESAGDLTTEMAIRDLHNANLSFKFKAMSPRSQKRENAAWTKLKEQKLELEEVTLATQCQKLDHTHVCLALTRPKTD